jgi:MFS family permease
LARELTKSNLYTTGVAIAETVPYLLFGLAGGAIADWVKKKPFLIWIDLLRAPLVLSVFLLHEAGRLTYWYLLVICFLMQGLGCFFNPAHRAVLPMITTLEERAAANSLLDTVTRGMQVASPAVTIVLLESAGVLSFFLFDASTYLCSACLLALIRLEEKEPAKPEKRNVSAVFSAIGQFIAWVKTENTLRKLFTVTFVTVFFNTWVWDVGLFLQVKQTTENGEAWFSALKGAFGGAVIVTNLLIPFLWKRLSLNTYLLGAAVWGMGIFTLAWAKLIPLYFAGILVAGMGMPLAGLSRVFLLQQLVPEEKLGRGFSFNAMLLYLANVLSLGLFGILSSFVPIRALFFICGAMMIAAAFAYLYLLRKEPGETPYMRLNS